MTNSIDRRLEEHRIGLNPDCYTFRKRPLKLIFHQEFIQFNQAEYYEKKIKKWSRSKKLALANEDFELLKDLSICKTATNYKNFKK
jgi:putative endonuclease